MSHENLRRAKHYPTGVSDEFFYDQADELIYDQGNSALSTPTYYTEDDYIWLGGRPVAMIRGMLNTSWGRQWDGNATCGRNGDVGACGVYFVVTDHIGKPVLMLDAKQRVVGMGEYDPFGQVNRTKVDQETTHPISVTTSGMTAYGTYQQPTWGGYTVATRPRVNEFDAAADGGCGGSYAGQGITFTTPGWSWSWGLCTMGGYVFPYLPLGSGDTASVTPYTSTAGSIWGAITDWWEYRRYDSAATPLWTPLRFPGQYHDDETDLMQNLNRFYNPLAGVMEEPEPLYTNSPQAITEIAGEGFATPIYAYASNNPIGNDDSSGLKVTAGPSCPANLQKQINSLINSIKKAPKCTCKALLDKILPQLTDSSVIDASCTGGKIGTVVSPWDEDNGKSAKPNDPDACGFNPFGDPKLSTRRGCECPLKELAYELLHSVAGYSQGDLTCSNPDQRDDPFCEVKRCVQCNGGLNSSP